VWIWPLAYPKSVLRAIEEAQPEVLLVAMDFPHQEKWIAANLPRLQVNVAVAEGGSNHPGSGGRGDIESDVSFRLEETAKGRLAATNV
jgi:hypothetical protein